MELDNNPIQEKNREALEYVLKAYKTYSNRAGLEDIWNKCDKIYNSVTTDKFYDGAAKLNPPETRRACKTLINFMDEVMFNSDPPYKLDGFGGKGDDDRAEVHSRLIQRDMSRAEVRSKTRSKAFEHLVKYGFTIVFCPYILKERYIISDAAERSKAKQSILNGEIPQPINKTLETLYDGPGYEVEDIHNIFWNYFRSWEDQDCIIRRKKVSWNHLYANRVQPDKDGKKIGVYINLEQVKAEKDLVGNNRTKTYTYSDDKSTSEKFDHVKDITGLSGSFDVGPDQHELLEAYCNWDLDNDGIAEECVIAVLDGKYLIRLETNPYDIQEKPFLWDCWDPIEGTSLGMGVCQVCENMQTALNDFTNQTMDNITMVINNMWVVDKAANIPKQQLKNRPNGVIYSDLGVEAVKALDKQLTADYGIKAAQLCREDIRQASGASMSLQGLPSRYDTTATEYTSSGNAAARDVLAKLRAFEDNIFKKWIKKAMSYNLQFLSKSDMVRLVGKDVVDSIMEPEQLDVKEVLRFDGDIIILGVSQMENKTVKAQQIINFLNIAGSMPQGIFDLKKIGMKAWSYLGDGDDSVIVDDPNDTPIDPRYENILLAAGEPITPKLADNHMQHLTIHGNNPMFAKHIMDHQMMMQPQPAMQMNGGGVIPAQEQAQNAPRPVDADEIMRQAGVVASPPVTPASVPELLR